VTAGPISASLIDWVIIGLFAVPFIAMLLAIGFADVRRERRKEREAARMRHPSAQHRTTLPKDVPKAA
jgi:hypothetical protein